MKKRFFAFTVCMAVLLASFTGCYSAQKNGPSAPASSQTVQSDSGSATENSVEIRTYDIPEENVQAGTRYVPSPTTGGFWMWTLFIQDYIQAYDPVTKSTYIPCYQTGCEHSDAFCSAYFGEISGLAEYRGNFYAMIYYTTILLRPLSRGRSPAVRFKSLRVGSLRMIMKYIGAASTAFLSGKPISQCQKKLIR